METPRFTGTISGISGPWLPRKWQLLPILSLFLILISSGCVTGNKWLYLPATKAQERSVYVVSHGWHTGIVLSKEELGRQLGFVDDYLLQGPYYEFGWGEAEFYQAQKVTAWIFLKAVFWRNPSVLHVAAVPENPKGYFRGDDVVELNVSERGLELLKDRLRASFSFDASGHPYPLKKGPDGGSRFFKSEGYYTIFNTCNRWTAKVLASGGVPMDTVFTLRAASVIREAKAARDRYLKVRPSGSTSGVQYLPHLPQ